MSLEISIPDIMASLIFGTIGLWLFVQAKRKANFTLMGISVVMMIYSYFTKSAWMNWGLGTALSFSAWYYWDQD